MIGSPYRDFDHGLAPRAATTLMDRVVDTVEHLLDLVSPLKCCACAATVPRCAAFRLWEHTTLWGTGGFDEIPIWGHGTRQLVSKEWKSYCVNCAVERRQALLEEYYTY